MKGTELRSRMNANQFSNGAWTAAWIALLLLQGCASVKPSIQGESSSSDSQLDSKSGGPRTVSDVIQNSDRENATRLANSVEYKELIVKGIRLKNTRFDYPVAVNSRVEHWVDYFTGRGRPYFEKYLERSEFFIPYIAPLLRQNKMPEDLVYLAMIESGFNNFARSHAKAVGPWQFISGTGRKYGLMVNWWVDERRDIRKSTLAAIEYLRDLYMMFGSWELAAAGYNAGEAKVARAIQRYGTKDFWVIARQRFLRPETRDYVPKIIAAALIAKNREQFGFPASNAGKVKPGEDEAVASDGSLVKVIKTDQPEQDLQKEEAEELALREAEGEEAADSTDAENSEADRVTETASAPIAGSDSVPLAKPIPTPHITKDGKVGGEELAEFEVKSPADLLKVARAAGLSYHTVKALNPELLRWCTPPGAGSFRLRLPASVKDHFLETYNHDAYPRQVKFMTYKIRRGETLLHVARRFGIHVDPISELNGLSSRAPLRSGTHVVLPIPTDHARSLAALDVLDPPSRSRRGRGRSYRRGGSSKIYRISYKRREAARATPKRLTDG